MGDLLQLAFEGGIDFWMAVAVQVGPDRGIRVEILATIDIAQDGACAGCDNDRLLFKPIRHLRKRVPDVAMIELGQRIHLEAACESERDALPRRSSDPRTILSPWMS